MHRNVAELARIAVRTVRQSAGMRFKLKVQCRLLTAKEVDEREQQSGEGATCKSACNAQLKATVLTDYCESKACVVGRSRDREWD